jgi:hypothetical protein
MTEVKNEKPAPMPVYTIQNSCNDIPIYSILSKREQIAAMMLQGLISEFEYNYDTKAAFSERKNMITHAIRFTDELIRQLEASNGEGKEQETK